MARVGVRLREERLTMHQLIELARLAEARGYESIWVPEGSGKEAFSQLTAYALSTQRIRLGTGIASQTNDDLPYILKYGTEDSLMIGTDYSHADQSAEIQALDVIEQRAEKGEIPASVARKILDDNPRRFYGL